MSQVTSLWHSMAEYGSVFVRVSLGVSFLSAVADRFGLWGAYGQPNVAWGDFSRFVAYTAKLNWYVPTQAAWGLAWVATVAETLLGVLLIVGLYTRMAALLSGVLLLLFALHDRSVRAKGATQFLRFFSLCRCFPLVRMRPVSVEPGYNARFAAIPQVR